MPDPELTRLSTTLGVAPAELQMLAGLPGNEVGALADAVRTALDAQRTEIDESLEHALGFIPRPLRGRARKLLFPADRRPSAGDDRG